MSIIDAGFFDFKTRKRMMTKWQSTLESLGIEFREDLGTVESLSTASQRLTWVAQGLPSDNLSIENGVILDRSSRFPLVIDPSGQAITYLINKHKEDKIQKTSFHDKAFGKILAGAIRFGTTLLVENVEKIDPILNPILNMELQRTGGRTLVRIGTEDVDYSPKFKIILSTKNPAVRLTPDLCSRVTLVNFTVTPDSLQSQSLSVVVKSLKPEIESKRASVLKLQGEQNVKLRELEDQMLTKISACEGSILDDDALVQGMERLMLEGAQVEEQIESSDQIMKQVHEAVSRFEPFASICRNIYVLLESIREISFLYEFTAKTFMRILDHILETNLDTLGSTIDESARIDHLRKYLFTEIAARIGRGLQADDQIVFSILLSRLFTGDMTIVDTKCTAKSSDELIGTIVKLFGDAFPWQGRSLSDLITITNTEISCHIPLLLCSAPGHDVSGRVESMAREMNVELSSVAMGSSEGYDMADTFVSMASKRGTWVLLKNVHLCVDWLRETLVKKIQSFGHGGGNIHPNFRLFITSEINPRLPTGLLQVSDTIVAQAPAGIKASLHRFFSSIPKDRLKISPIRSRLYLLLGWVHCVIQERLRFIPNGWSEAYEWTEADAIHALDVIDSLLVQEKNPTDPEKLPWDAIRSTLRKGVYGGRITRESDQKVLDELVDSVFVSRAYDVGFQLVSTDCGGPVFVPEECSREQIMDWIHNLPSRTPPSWIGLDDSAEVEREQRTAKSVIQKVQLVQEKCNINS
jgi:dynein heavy chain 1, cytosolic